MLKYSYEYNTKYLCLHLCALCIGASSLSTANNKPNVILIVAMI